MSSPKLGRRYSSLNSTPSTGSLHESTPTLSACSHGDLLTQLEELRKQVNYTSLECIHTLYVCTIKTDCMAAVRSQYCMKSPKFPHQRSHSFLEMRIFPTRS